MKGQGINRPTWTILLALVVMFVIVGCIGQGSAPTLPPESSSTVAPSSTLVEASSPTPGKVEPSATLESGTDKNVLFQDSFINPGTGWDDAKLGNYFVGYHGPEWYHIEISSPRSKVPISEPNKTSYEDVTLDLQVFAVAAKTDPSGDFRYGLAFRRSGDQYYAFTISPNTKNWEMLKISPEGVETLKEGVDESIHDLDAADLLRVDALGSSFLLHINDHLVGQVTDSTYPSGEVGLYAESLDSPKIHIHYDTFDIRDVQLDLICSINEGTFNVRSGPSKTFAQLAVLSAGDTLQPLGTSPNREWIQIRIEGSDEPGWISYSEGLMSCTPSVDLFPIVSP